MDALPVEVIGNILSLLAAARDVILASATCRKWRQAVCNHLSALRFSHDDWPAYLYLSTEELEVLITQTILQTSCLRNLSLHVGEKEFSAAPVIAWLTHTRQSLRILTYMIHSRPFVNLLDECGRQKLEVLCIGNQWIPTVDPNLHKFAALCSLTLNRITISALNVQLLLGCCSKLESLSLIRPRMDSSLFPSGLDSELFVRADNILALTSQRLKSFSAEGLRLDNFTLDVENLESISLKDTNLKRCEIACKGGLRVFKMDNGIIDSLDFHEVRKLEVVDLRDIFKPGPYYNKISQAHELRWLRLWLPFGQLYDTSKVVHEVMDMETIALSFPHLTRLSLRYELGKGVLQHVVQGTSMLEKVTLVEVGYTKINELFYEWICVLLERCPNLKRLVVHGYILKVVFGYFTSAEVQEEDQKIASLKSFVSNLILKYLNVEIAYDFSGDGPVRGHFTELLELARARYS